MKNSAKKTTFFKTRQARIRPIANIIATYLWPVLFVLVSLIFVFRPTFRFHQQVQVDSPAEINTKKEPSFFVHITDIHLTDLNIIHAGKIWNVFHDVSTIIKPDAVLLTGDITDGTQGRGKLQVHGQFEENWRPYIQIVNDHPNLNIIQVAGNHDEVLVDSINSSNHFYNNIVNQNKDDQFILSTKYVETKNGKVRVVAWNPYRFPMPPVPLYLFAKPTKQMLNNLEKALRPDNTSIFTIVLCHYPLQSIEKIKSSSKKTTEQILAAAGVRYFLSGHFHIPEAFTQRFGKYSVEGIGPNLIKAHSIALLSIDNEITTYQNIDIEEEIPYIMTIPQPENQFTASSKYLKEEFRARITVFSLMAANISVFIDNNYIGEMEEDLRTDHFITYGIHVKTNNGVHTIKTDGDIQMSRNFIVGDHDTSTVDIGLIFFLHYKTLMNIVFIIIFATVSCVFVLPILLDFAFSKQLKDYGHFLFRTFPKNERKLSFKKPKQAASSVYTLAKGSIRSIFVGPWYIIWRSHFMPRFNKILLIVMFLQTFFLPLYWVKRENGSFVTVTMIGYITHWRLIPDAFCIFIGSAYQMCIIWSLNFLGGLYTEAYRWCPQLSIDFFIWQCLIHVFFWIVIFVTIPGAGLLFLPLSPVFVFSITEVIIFMRTILAENRFLRTTSFHSLQDINQPKDGNE